MTKTILTVLGVVLVVAHSASCSKAETEAPPTNSLTPSGATRTLATEVGHALYVSPQGTATSDGSRAHPLDLVTALSATGPANPGDTIYLLGGTYVGNFKGELRGAESAPITVRPEPGARVTLTAKLSTAPALTVEGLWTWYRCMEITNTSPVRTSAEVQNVSIRQGTGVTVATAAHVKFINMIVHDLAGGFVLAPEADDVEVYGNVIYYNGWQRADGVGEGHGILTPNQTAGRFIRENIAFDNFSHGIQAYGNQLDNIVLEGNVLFDNGAVAKFLDRNLMVGPGSKNLVVNQNMTYFTEGPAASGESTNLGFGGNCIGARVTGNYFTGSNPLNLTGCKPAEMSKNTLHGRYDGTLEKRFPDNSYMAPKAPPLPTMSGVKVFVRPNQYEPGRANIAVFNWDRLPSVTVEVPASVLKSGDEYELRNAEDYFGQLAASGRYTGGPLTVQMRGLKHATPVGVLTRQPPDTAPGFGVFVLINTTRVHTDSSAGTR